MSRKDTNQILNQVFGNDTVNVRTDTNAILNAVYDEESDAIKINMATQWDDLRFPLYGSNIDSNAGRVDINYFNGTLGFATNARFPNEPISMIAQLPHSWKAGTIIKPHIHWIQRSVNLPNWLLAYKIMKNGEAVNIDTNFDNHIKVACSAELFPYVSGEIMQICQFPDIDTTGMDISDTIHFVLFRDTANTSGLFAGADPSSEIEHSIEFDIHYQVNSFGSNQEYVK